MNLEIEKIETLIKDKNINLALKECEKIREEAKDNEIIFKTLIYLTNLKHYMGLNKEALEYAREAFFLSKEISSLHYIFSSRLYSIRIQDYQLRNNWYYIKDLLLEGIKLAEELERKDEISKNLILLCEYGFLKRDFKNYEIWKDRLWSIINNNEINEKLKNEILSRLYLVDSIYVLPREEKKAYYFMKKALEYAKMRGIQYYILRVYIQYARYYLFKGSKRALVVFDAVLNRLNNIDLIPYYQWEDMKLEVIFTKAITSLHLKIYDDALRFAAEAYKIAKSLQSIEMEGECLVLIAKVNSEKGDKENAIKSLENAKVFCKHNMYEDLLEDIAVIEKKLRD